MTHKYVSPIGYAGGKFYMLEDIYELVLGNEFDTFIDVFGGSGKVLLNLPVSTLYGSYRCIYNDLDDKMTNFYNVIKNSVGELIDIVASYNLTDNDVNNFSNRRYYDGLSDTMKAYAMWVNQTYAWSGFGASTYRHKVSQIDTNVDYVAKQFRMAHNLVKDWEILNLDYNDLKYLDGSNVMWYFDPPYKDSDAYYYNFGDNDYRKLYKFQQSLEGQYLMNIDEDQYIKAIFGKPHMVKKYRNLMTKPQYPSDREEWFYWKFYH